MNKSIIAKQKCVVPVDTEDLIRTIEQYRAIWDIEDESYHNKYIKEEAWHSVCLYLVSDWETLTKDEQYVRRNELKKKWNNVRDYFKKLILAERSAEGKDRSKKRRYLYDDVLEFIRPVYVKPKSKSIRMRREHKPMLDHSDSTSVYVDDGPNPSSDSEAKDDDGNELEKLNFVNLPSPEDTRPTSSPTPTKQNTPLPRKRRLRFRPAVSRFSPLVSPLLSTSELERSRNDHVQSMESRANAPNDDPDLLFLRSLLPDMKKLSDSQKFDFKLGIMKLYRNISRRDSEEQDQLCDDGKSNVKFKMELDSLFDDEDE